MKIYLIRHGQTTGDVEGLYGGTYDDRLSAKGKGQVKKLASKLTGRGIEIIYSSPYLRAKETADILEKTLKVPIEIKDDLRERNVYAFMSGKNKEEMKEKHPDKVKILQDYRQAIQDAEEYEDFKKRMLSVVDEIAFSNHQTIAIVTHGGPIRCFYREVLNPGNEIEPTDCEVLEIEYQDKKYHLKGSNNGIF